MTEPSFDQEDSPALPGSIPQRYLLKEELGRGGMGIVYRAHDTLLERDVAVKLLDKAALGTEGRARLLREARAIARLNHPNIVAVYDAGELNGDPFLVMELVEGETLREKMSAPLEQKLGWMVQICQALEHAHGQGVLHRDLKPENIFIGSDGRVRLADFGLARRVETQHITQSGTLVGTPAYISPEQLRGEELDGRTDLYALGVMLYELTTGRLPFDGETLMAVLSQHLHGVATPPRQINPVIPPALEELILHLLCKMPADRLQNAHVVREALEKVLQPAAPVDSWKSRPKHNLPSQTIPFVGREDVLAEIKERLDDPACRLLTLVGPGGSGKTRLALETGKRQLENYEHGAFFVSLEALSSADSIVPAVAEALGFSFYKAEMGGQAAEPRQQLFNFLMKKSLLLILDNYEHLLEGAGVASGILQVAPQVKILATSRARLDLFDEQTFYVPGMQHPTLEPGLVDEQVLRDAQGYSAVKLFVQAANRAQPGFALNPKTLPGVAHICQLVEGMPLGILLAAAWLRLLSLEEIAGEIEKGLDLLETGLRDLPDRQRSMRAVFDRSWGMLSEREKRVFAALSVFRGGCMREAAQDVAGATPNDLLALVDRSCVQREANGRYTLHRLLSQYAADRLAEDPEIQLVIRERHSVYFAGRMVGWEKDLKGACQGEAIREMDVEIENCRAAWEWAVEFERNDLIEKMLECFYRIYRLRWRNLEGETIFRNAIEGFSKIASLEGNRLLSRLMIRQAYFLSRLEPLGAISPVFDQAQSLLDDLCLKGQDVRREQAELFLMKGNVVGDTANYEQAGRWMEQSLKLYRALDDKWSIAEALFGLGEPYWMAGNANRAIQCFEESLALYRDLGDLRGMGNALLWLGYYSIMRGNVVEAEAFFKEGLIIHRRTNDPWGLSWTLFMIGFVVLILGKGEFYEAEPFLKEAIDISTEYRMPQNQVLTKVGLGFSKLGQGDYGAAGDIFQSTLELARETGDPRLVALALWGLGWLRLVTGEFEAAFIACQEGVILAQGKYMPPNEQAWILAVWGAIACIKGLFTIAQDSLMKALQINIEMGTSGEMIFSFPVTALFLEKRAKKELAVEVYAFAAAHFPFVAKARFMDDIIGQRIRAAAASLPPEVVAAAEVRGRARDLWQTASELLAELEGQIHDE